jgi:hypothetical protein
MIATLQGPIMPSIAFRLLDVAVVALILSALT